MSLTPTIQKPSLFLSYGREDDNPAPSFMRRLYNNLTARGFNVWWDQEKMPNRMLTFTEEIQHAIDTYDRLILVVGNDAMASDYVRAEWQYARSICKPVISILRMGDYDLLPPELKPYHCPDFRETRSYDEALAELLSENILGTLIAPLGRLEGQLLVPPIWVISRPEAFMQVVAQVRASALQPTVITGRAAATIIHAPPGIGKSTLAALFARDCETRRSFPDGVIGIELGRNPDVASRQGDIGAIFHDSRENYKDVVRGKTSLQHILADKTVLIILDDAWDYHDVEAFLINAPHCRWLITTRKIRIATLLKLSETQIVKLGQLSETDGLALIAGRLRLDPTTDYPYKETHREIVRLLEGHTQAIAITAARLESQEEGQDFAPRLLDRLRTRLDGDTPFKDLTLGDEEDREYSLEASLSLSYDDLKPALRYRFRLLGAFAAQGTFDTTLAASLWGDEKLEDAEDALGDLVRSALLDRTGNGRYSQHTLLRAYARALLLREAEFHYALSRHLMAYISLHNDFNANNKEGRHQVITLDFENISAALKWGFEQERETAFHTIQFIGALQYYLTLYQSLATQKKLFDLALQASERIELPLAVANCLTILGQVILLQDDLEGAHRSFSRALKLFEQTGQRQGRANVLSGLGSLFVRQGNLERARDAYNQALILYQETGDQLGRATVLTALGEIYVSKGNLASANASYAQALMLYEALGDRRGRAHVLKLTGDLLVRQDDLSNALDFYKQALTICRELADRVGQANVLRVLGNLCMRQGDLDGAQNYLNQALALYKELGNRIGEAQALMYLGILAMQQNNLVGAEDYCNQALVRCKEADSQRDQANILKVFGDLRMRQKDLIGAEDLYNQALKLYEQLDSRLGLANLYESLGDLLTTKHLYEQAIAAYNQAAHFAPDQYTHMLIFVAMITSLVALQDYEKALTHLFQALTYFVSKELTVAVQAAINRMRSLRSEIGKAAFDSAWKKVTGGQPLPEWLQDT